MKNLKEVKAAYLRFVKAVALVTDSAITGKRNASEALFEIKGMCLGTMMTLENRLVEKPLKRGKQCLLKCTKHEIATSNSGKQGHYAY